jgi:hypothetical protein
VLPWTEWKNGQSENKWFKKGEKEKKKFEKGTTREAKKCRRRQ